MAFGKKTPVTPDFEDTTLERIEAILARVTAMVDELTKAQAAFAKASMKAAAAARALNKAAERAEYASRNSK